MRRHVGQRQEQVLEIVRRRGSLRVTELAEELGVSAVTVRRDVEGLAAQGKLHRMHGAVLWPQGTAGDSTPADEPALMDGGGPTVGMVVPTTEHYFAELVRGAQEELAAHGGRIVLGLSHYSSTEDEDQVARMRAADVDGMLLVPVWEHGAPGPGQERRLLEVTTPTVIVDRWVPPASSLATAFDSVRSDHATGTARAVRHLADLGHRSIALMVRQTPSTPHVREGFETAAKACGLATLRAPLLMEPPADPAGVDAAVEELCAAMASHGVRAALVHNDQDALGVLQRLRARGVRVPQDLALAAYEDDMASLADVPLTAVAPPRRAVGAESVRLLMQRMDSGRNGPVGPRRHLTLVPALHVRRSSGTGGASAFPIA